MEFRHFALYSLDSMVTLVYIVNFIQYILLSGCSIRINLTVREDILAKIAVDLLSIPPLIFREIRRKLIKTTIAGIDADITPLHMEIMRLLEKEGKLHAAEIGDRLLIARAQMTKLIDKLVYLKLVERQTDVADRRITILTLSPYGKAVLREHKAAVMNAVRETMEQLSDEDLKDLSNTLRTLQDILSKLH